MTAVSKVACSNNRCLQRLPPCLGRLLCRCETGDLFCPKTAAFLCCSLQTVGSNLFVELLENACPQFLPECRCDKVRQLHVRIVLVTPSWENIFFQRGALLSFEHQPPQIGALRSVQHVIPADVHPSTLGGPVILTIGLQYPLSM